eukprot:TRINITY_DN2372_c0_g1_i1.p1 TRINITY_DN2372_c0_g1~~TRINITY_DN2372_c0_g1_i1.p1  ORF type:complete len:293 (-),score=52.71 TRINITY_DN2372_c0_g1_i1:101-979(-)
MRSIIFANYIASDTSRLGSTVNVENAAVRFLGNLLLNLWDCGGQERFFENYLTSQREHIFSNVEVLLYVFDVSSEEFESDLEYYQGALQAIKEFSPEAKIFCLIHKMDLISEDERDEVFLEKRAILKSISLPLKMVAFKTSIWDETLYKAWSRIVHSLIPNAQLLETNLNRLCSMCEANEVVLFEKATFLVISHGVKKSQNEANEGDYWCFKDPHRFEKISNIIKQFKLSCLKLNSQFQSIQIRNSNYHAYIDEFTPNTYLMVVLSDPTIQPSVIGLNIKAARRHFEPLLAT